MHGLQSTTLAKATVLTGPAAERLCEDADLRNIAMSHKRGNPLKAADIREQLNISEYRQAPCHPCTVSSLMEHLRAVWHAAAGGPAPSSGSCWLTGAQLLLPHRRRQASGTLP